jgi:hypothetical protein
MLHYYCRKSSGHVRRLARIETTWWYENSTRTTFDPCLSVSVESVRCTHHIDTRGVSMDIIAVVAPATSLRATDAAFHHSHREAAGTLNCLLASDCWGMDLRKLEETSPSRVDPYLAEFAVDQIAPTKSHTPVFARLAHCFSSPAVHLFRLSWLSLQRVNSFCHSSVHCLSRPTFLPLESWPVLTSPHPPREQLCHLKTCLSFS